MLVSGIRMILLASSQHNLYDIYHLLLRVHCQTPNDGQRNCPKHIEFYSQNKFEKLVHRVGFIIRMTYHSYGNPSFDAMYVTRFKSVVT